LEWIGEHWKGANFPEKWMSFPEKWDGFLRKGTSTGQPKMYLWRSSEVELAAD
jgi:hypothetical protein